MNEIDLHQRICVIGYFNHANAGDEQYKDTFTHLFDTYLPKNTYGIIEYSYKFIDCDLLKITKMRDTDIIVLGGGDILNNYFLDQIILKFKGRPNKIIAVSVGLPYIDLIIGTNKLNIIDYIFVRTQQDMDLFKEFFHPHRIMYIPDLSFYLLDSKFKMVVPLTQCDPYLIEPIGFPSVYNELKNIKQNSKKIVALSISSHNFSTSNYNELFMGIIKFINYLTTFNFHVVLLPFNTNENNLKESDITIHTKLFNYIKETQCKNTQNITNIDFSITHHETLAFYKLFYITVPMRFHATLFSIYSNVPFLPIFTTRKIKNLLLDIDWQFGYELEKNTSDMPIELDLPVLIRRFSSMLSARSNLVSKLIYVNRDIFTKQMRNNASKIINIITDSSPILKNKDNFLENTSSAKIACILQKFKELGYSDTNLSTVSNDKTKDLLVCIVSYYLTNSINSVYNFGLKEKMFTINYNYKAEWDWVYKDYIKRRLANNNKLINNPYGLFNLGYIDQIDYSGAHRSGWQYVYDHIKYLHNDQNELILDLYLDRTFHWNKEINKVIGLIPYTQHWIGFVHHTFDTSFSDYNCYNLIANPDFIESLKLCKGLFVLSQDLKSKFLIEFNKIKDVCIPDIYVITHPTEINVPNFTYKNFIENDDKKLVNIGGWLRNIYSFYTLCLENKYSFVSANSSCISYSITDTFRKVSLKGTNMNNYYPTENWPTDYQNFLIQYNTPSNKDCSSNCSSNSSTNVSQNSSSNSSHCVSQNSSQNSNASQNTAELTNNWYKHSSEHVKYMCDTVDIIYKLDNAEYDELLTKNVVFINLVDASAVNTIIECIVRNTPIIVNRHPAVVELLGPHYPLYYGPYQNYYDFNNQISKLLCNNSSIKRAHVYLSKLNKSKYNVKSFVHDFINIVKTL